MVQTEQKQETVVVKPARDIVASYVEEFRGELQSLVSQGKTDLVIDLAQVNMLDSKGLAVFMLCHKSVQPLGGKLTVITSNPDFRQLFRVMRMDEHFSVKESL